jgi:hypothetical protein
MKLAHGQFLPLPFLVTFQGNPCEICGGQIGAGAGFAPIFSPLSRTNAPYSWPFINHRYVLKTSTLCIYIYIYETIDYKLHTPSQNY